MARAAARPRIVERPSRPVPLRQVAGLVVCRWPAVGVFLLLGAGWELGARWAQVPAYLLPSPGAIVARLLASPELFASAALMTLAEALAGLALASLAGLTAAVVMAHRPWAERALFPLAVAVKVTPMVAIAPLLVLWLGFGPAPKIVVAALISFFPIVSNALIGFRAVNPRTLDLLRSLDATPVEIFWRLRLPHALPYLFSAYKVSTALCVVGAVVSEWVGAEAGIGHLIILANANLDMTTLAAAVVVLAAVVAAVVVVALIGAALTSFDIGKSAISPRRRR